MLSITCKAAIKSVIFLGLQFEKNERTSMRQIAVFINENEHTVGKLLQKLVKDGIINSAKGPTGGFYLTEEQTQQPVIGIVHAIDGAEVFNQCGLGLSKCSSSHPCPFHHQFEPIRNIFKEMCAEKKVAELYQDVNSGLAFLAG